jgi:hypothetical protein
MAAIVTHYPLDAQGKLRRFEAKFAEECLLFETT